MPDIDISFNKPSATPKLRNLLIAMFLKNVANQVLPEARLLVALSCHLVESYMRAAYCKVYC